MFDVIFFDKDNTLGNFYPGDPGLFPNVTPFLRGEKDKGRKLYVTTQASEVGAAHLREIADLFDGYFGREQINTSDREFYFRADGSVGSVRDYESRESRLSPERKVRKWELELARKDRLDELHHDSPEVKKLQKRINDHFDYWQQILHKETGEPYDPQTEYKNPHIVHRFSKDIHLARRHISPTKYMDLRTVMVGDAQDSDVPASDPETPLIVVSYDVRQGNWNLVEVMLDTLFSDPRKMPWETYDALFSAASASETSGYKDISINEIDFLLRRGDHQERLIGCR